MKTSTPLSFVLAGVLAGSLYGTPWALMWLLGLAPPELELEMRGPPDAVFMTIDISELSDVDELVDPEDVDADGTAEEPEPPDEPIDEEGEPGTTESTEGGGGDAVEIADEPEATAAGGEKGAKKAPARRRRRSKQCKAPHPNVRTARDGAIEVDRVFVEKMTRNIKTFMSLGYSRPYREDGVKGWYISGFGCTSPVFKAGFRRKDVLLDVNGKTTRTVTGVFMLYMKLKKRSEFEVRLLRRGEERTLKFRVVPG